MATTAFTLLHVTLVNPSDEERLLAWWREARRVLARRFRSEPTELLVESRGTYVALIGFPLPGTWKVVTQHRDWLALEPLRPHADIEVRQARRWHDEGGPRDMTTSELERLLAERARGERDLVLIDSLSPASFADRHLPGAVNLPLDAIDAERAAEVIGPDKDRMVVVYCSGYG